MDDAVKSIRIIVDAVVAAIQSGLAQRDSRRADRGPSPARATSVHPESSSGVSKRPLRDHQRGLKRPLADHQRGL